MLKKAERLLDHSDFEQRRVTGTTMAVNPEKLKFADAMIDKFRKDLTEFLESGTHKTSIYHLNVNLIPLDATNN